LYLNVLIKFCWWQENWKNKIEQNGVGKGYENKLVTQKSNNFER